MLLKNRDRMDSEGYLILKNFCEVDSLLEKVKPSVEKTEFIFNGQGKNDHKRRQVKLPMSIVSELQQKILALPFVGEFHTVKDFVLLRSLPGCKRQQAHTDYIPDARLKHCPANERPLLFLFAIEDNTKLVVWPSSHKVVQGLGRSMDPVEPLMVVLDKGDAFLFRADLVHAGAEYGVENIRIHCYIDSQAVPRNPNRTWIIKKHSDSFIQQKIIEV